MNVEAWITKLSDFLCKKLNSLSGVTEDDRLIDLELEEKNTKWRVISQNVNKTVLLEAVFTLRCIFVLLALSANFMFIINTFSFLLNLTKKKWIQIHVTGTVARKGWVKISITVNS